MLTILIANQKGGVGKTTIADELAFELERRGASVSFISTDPQGGSVHETDDGDEERDWRIVDTPGVLADALPEWCEAADMVLVPMEDQMNQPGTMSPAPQKPKRPAKSQRKGGRLYTIEEANTFAASMCAMSDETKLSDALEIADSTGNAFVYKGGRLMGVVLSCDKYAEVSKGK